MQRIHYDFIVQNSTTVFVVIHVLAGFAWAAWLVWVTLLGVVGSKLFSQTKPKSLRSSIGEEQKLDHKVARNSSQCMVAQC